MRKIRRNVFETNSSSTHSISIYKWTPTKESKVPYNTKLIVDGKISAQTEIKDELGKLNYIIAILASVAEHRRDYSKDEEDFETLISNNHFTWLKEIIKDKCNTYIIYEATNSYYPYFETTYDECTDIEDVLGCNIDDKKEFKNRVEEIIFNEEYVIEDKENEY